MRKKIKHLLHQKSGVSMVEVIIAFLVVVMMMGAFSLIVSTAVSLTNRSNQMITNNEQFEAEYYKKPGQRAGTDKAVGSTTIQLVQRNNSDMKIGLPKAKLKQYTHDATGISRYYLDAQ